MITMEEVKAQAKKVRAIRLKFHTEHTLSKEETDAFDIALNNVLCYIDNEGE